MQTGSKNKNWYLRFKGCGECKMLSEDKQLGEIYYPINDQGHANYTSSIYSSGLWMDCFHMNYTPDHLL